MQTILDISYYVLIGLLFVYIRQILFFHRGLARLTKGTNTKHHSFTIIIAARNEENNIGRCLNSIIKQDYPKDKLSIIVVNDQSVDRTGEIVTAMASASPFPIILLHSSAATSIPSPKTRAISLGVQHSSSEIILTTDADCIATPNWISTMNSYFEEGIGVVAGLTVYEKTKDVSPLFWGFQYLDFISYSAIAAGAIGMNRVLVNNGSNMAFRIQAFNDIEGFKRVSHVIAGDDSVLSQKLVEDGTWNARFAFERNAAIETQHVSTLKQVFRQRMRWVTQTSHYPGYMMFFMICTFIMYVSLFMMIPWTMVQWNFIPWLVVFGKFAIDYVIMNRFTTITGTKVAMNYFIPTALIHIPFVLIATIGGYFFSFEWKERTLRKELS